MTPEQILVTDTVRNAFLNLRGCIDERWQIEARHDASGYDLAGDPAYVKADAAETAAELALISAVLRWTGG